MKQFAFVGRHAPTPSQLELAAKAGIELTVVGDYDGFTLKSSDFEAFNGVIVAHAQAAIRAIMFGEVGVFNNVNRAALGEKPQFETTSLVVTSFTRSEVSHACPDGSDYEETVYTM